MYVLETISRVGAIVELTLLAASPPPRIHSLLLDVWCKNYPFGYLVYFGVIWSRRINVSYAPLCLPKWRSPCNQNSLNALWMLGAEFCEWAHTLLGICVGALGSPSLSGETCQLQIVFAMGYVQFSSVAQSCPTLQLHRLQHARARCSSPTPGAWANSCPSSWWFHPTISSSNLSQQQGLS